MVTLLLWLLLIRSRPLMLSITFDFTDPCLPNPCKNTGSCQSMQQAPGLYNYTCTCPAGTNVALAQ